LITEEDALRACQKAGVEIAVPDDEQEPVRRVVVEVSGGCAEVVELDPGVAVEIRDYDCKGCELTGDPTARTRRANTATSASMRVRCRWLCDRRFGPRKSNLHRKENRNGKYSGKASRWQGGHQHPI